MDEKGRMLLSVARQTIAEVLAQPGLLMDETAPWMEEWKATFVTLTREGQLRGCMGTLDAHRAVLADVKANSIAAAFHDPRFSPLEDHELHSTRIEVSVLSEATRIPFESESDALSLIEPGRDGLILTFGHHRSTFLPQVWEQLPKPREFLRQLKRKAGLSADFWANDLVLSRYTVDKWKESDATPNITSVLRRHDP